MAGAVSVRRIGKRFRRFHGDRPRSLKQALFRGLRGVRPQDTFWALRDVSFDVVSGRILGVIGHNGAGKSTLLRMIGGIGRPDEGTVQVCGHLVGMLDLGAGFSLDLSGRENVYVNGVIGGLTLAQVQERFDDIVDFAELAEVIESPLRTYSQGMRQRLGFSVAMHCEADVLLVDELLAVGDQRFNRKCMERIESFRASGGAIVLVSHSLDAVRNFCDEAIQIRQGRVVARGSAQDVVAAYERETVQPRSVWVVP